jgi:hypothetical protein
MTAKIEKMPWLKQAKQSVDCAAVAILNAKLWQGEKVRRRDIARLAQELGISIEKDGVSGSDVDRWMQRKKNMGVRRELQPSGRKVMGCLKTGHGVILRYCYRIGDRQGAHYAFLAMASHGRILMANPHGLAPEGKRENWRYVLEKEVRTLCRSSTLGRRIYPMSWLISKQ